MIGTGRVGNCAALVLWITLVRSRSPIVNFDKLHCLRFRMLQWVMPRFPRIARGITFPRKRNHGLPIESTRPILTGVGFRLDLIAARIEATFRAVHALVHALHHATNCS